MRPDLCPYCDREGATRSDSNRHIRAMSQKASAKARGNHPEEGTPEYDRMATSRRFHAFVETVEEKKARAVAAKQLYKKRRQEKDSNSVERALCQLSTYVLIYFTDG
jgi:transcription termination factor NusB